MHDLTSLLLSIAPLVLFAAVSPVVFLNASTAVSRGGQRGGWQFVEGNAIVLLLLGVAFVGVLGSAASDFAEREMASRAVDRILGLALVGYGGWLAWTHRQSVERARSRAERDAAGPVPASADASGRTPATVGVAPARGRPTGDAPAGTPADERGLVAWGAIGMATNFTSLPVYASVSQRIGAAEIGWVARILVLLIASWVVLTPSWLPVVIARFSPGRSDVSVATRARIAHWTGLVSIAACFIGGVVLLATSF